MNQLEYNIENYIYDRRVSSILVIILCIIFIGYKTTIIKDLPCNTDIISTFLTNFVHIDLYHLIANLYGIFAFSKIEADIGVKNFAILVSLILIITSIIESIVKKLFKFKCSIGISGLIFALFGYDLVSYNDFNIYIISSLSIIFLRISLESRGTSFYGHLIGFITGIFLGRNLNFNNKYLIK